MKVAIVGSGIAGLSAALELHNRGCEVTIYEASKSVGGHVRTLRVPPDDPEEAPHELGVFMLNPKNVHPSLAALANKLHIPIGVLPLHFSMEFPERGLSWSTVSKLPPALQSIKTIFSQIFNNIGSDLLISNLIFFKDFFLLARSLKKIIEDPQYTYMSVAEFIKTHSISSDLIDCWLVPHLQCWWGVPREQAFSCSIQVVLHSFYTTARDPQYYFVKGWAHFIETLYKPFRHRILTDRRVDQVIREKQGVRILSKGECSDYDEVILATPPNIALQLLSNPTEEEKTILSSFPTCETEVFLHTDSSWTPKTQKKALLNLIRDQRGQYTTLWSGGIHRKKTDVYLTWGDRISEAPDLSKIIFREKWLRVLPTVDYVKACRNIHGLQGRERVWYCGAHVHSLSGRSFEKIPSLWHENAFLSGKLVAEKILSREKVGSC